MEAVERLGAGDLVAVLFAYRDTLRAHQQRINRLNVYPVPDGDTGTNMALTLESVAKDLEAAGAGDMATVAHALRHGSLMGARGNSGVILSQMLRGLADVFAETEAIDGAVLASGLARAAEDAYKAVQEPVEGTILTVARAAADAAADAAAQPGTKALVTVLEAAKAAAEEALERTPEMLPVLAQSGVVDAGGAGLVLLLDAFLHVVDGRPLPPSPVDGGLARATAGTPLPEAGAQSTEGGGQEGPRYEVMYLLEAPDDSIESFRQVWAGVGDSIVVVGGDGLWNCHIHTDDIGAAIEAAIDVGRPRDIRVTDLHEQVEEERWVRERVGGGPEDEGASRAPVRCAVVAVSTGEGIKRIFRSLGVTNFVTGGQSANPSTAELLAAIEAAPAEEVVVLPNNKNVVAVAEQAAAESEKSVRVVPTAGIQEGFAALLEYDPEGDADANASLMAEASSRVVAGEVTQAVRDSFTDAGPVREGDWIGLSRRGVESVASDLAGAATGLLERLIDASHHEIVTIIAGDGSTEAVTRRIKEWLGDHHPGLAVEVHRGGQPLYPYLFSVE